MANTHDIAKLALDIYNGKPTGTYSADQANDVLLKALVDANGGKTSIDYRDMRDGKCGALFAIIEEVLSNSVENGLQGNEFFFNFVETKNLKLGDKNEFYVPDDYLLPVSEVAAGTVNIRRQRLNGGTPFTVPMKRYGIKVYEEMDRVVSGRVDFNHFIDVATRSLTKARYDDIYASLTGIVAGSDAPYIPAAGSYDEATLLELCEHVEVNNGVAPVIMGTRSALRKITTATVAEVAKEDMYNMGYYGMFNGYKMMRINQIHKADNKTFLLPNNVVYVVGADNKFIKYVTEGDTLVKYTAAIDNADLTEEWLAIQKAGSTVAIGDKKIGVYTMSN